MQPRVLYNTTSTPAPPTKLAIMLLSDLPQTPKFSIRMRQEPRACGFGERDRGVIDPPPILEMFVDAPNTPPEELQKLEAAKIQLPYAIVHCTLWDPSADSDAIDMPGMTGKGQRCRLMGTMIAQAFVGRDENGVKGCFFCFPNLRVKVPGTYSLRHCLVILDLLK